MNKENGDPKVFVSPLSTATVVILQVVSRPRPKPGQVLDSTATDWAIKMVQIFTLYLYLTKSCTYTYIVILKSA